MPTPEYDVIFGGGGQTALLLLEELRGVLPERVAFVDPSPPLEQSPVRWSGWSHQQRSTIGSLLEERRQDGERGCERGRQAARPTLHLRKSSGGVHDEHCRPSHPAAAQGTESFVGLLEREGQDLGTHRHLGG